MIATLVVGALTALAALHVFWAVGGRWPAKDDASFVAMTIGRTKHGKPPGPLACSAVAAALAASAAFVALKAELIAPGRIHISLVDAGFWMSGAVFLARAIAGFSPRLTRYAEGTPFHRLNRLVYSPLCLAIALGYAAVAVS